MASSSFAREATQSRICNDYGPIALIAPLFAIIDGAMGRF